MENLNIPTAPKEGCVETFTGKIVDVMDLKPGDVDIRDIAHALSQEPRHGGMCTRRISVANHSCKVHDLLVKWGHGSEICLYGLLHDAEEAYIGDLARPIKYLDELMGYRKVANVIKQSISNEFDLYSMRDIDYNNIIKLADNICLYAETRRWKRSNGVNVMGRLYDEIKDHLHELPNIYPWSDSKGRREFLKRFRKYRPNAKVGGWK